MTLLYTFVTLRYNEYSSKWIENRHKNEIYYTHYTSHGQDFTKTDQCDIIPGHAEKHVGQLDEN